MKPVKLCDITAGGETLRRAEMNYKRLHAEIFRYPVLKTAVQQAPGDSIGRVILGLTLLGRLLERRPKYIGEMIERLPEMFNERGFIDIIPAHENGIFCEQEIGGHNALLRGLCEQYQITQDARLLSWLGQITDNLIIPAVNALDSYPLSDLSGEAEGEQAALISTVRNGWRLSTDVGAVFLCLDGVTHAYQILGGRELKRVAEKFISRYMELDQVAVNAHTHSTMSALRGIIRFYETDGCKEKRYIDFAARIFDLYKNEAMTDDYANYNWFGRPYWTEPCTIVDSFTVAMWLWKNTAREAYLEDAQLIYFNALLAHQRENGGFGCNECAGSDGGARFVKVHPGLYEAACCCTMRGAEGLVRFAEYSYFTDGNTLVMPYFDSNRARLRFDAGDVVLTQTADILRGEVFLHIDSSTMAVPAVFRMYIPAWADRASVMLAADGEVCDYKMDNGWVEACIVPAEGTVIRLTFDNILRKLKSNNKNISLHKYLYGPILLGTDDTGDAVPENPEIIYPGIAYDKKTGVLLRPVNDFTGLSREAAEKTHTRILFG